MAVSLLAPARQDSLQRLRRVSRGLEGAQPPNMLMTLPQQQTLKALQQAFQKYEYLGMSLSPDKAPGEVMSTT